MTKEKSLRVGVKLGEAGGQTKGPRFYIPGLAVEQFALVI